MTLSAHQPCYLPAISFFQKLASADIFVLADDYKYTTSHQINRAKIKTNNGWNWLTLPVLTSGLGGQLIKDVRINSSHNWQEKHLRTLHSNYTYAAYFEQYIDQFEAILTQDYEYLVELNFQLISLLVNELELSTKIILCSDLNLSRNGNHKLFEMLNKTNCTTYLADAGLKGFLKQGDFANEGYDLKFLKPNVRRYYQLFEGFIPNLSIVDLLFNEGLQSRSFISPEAKDEE